MGEPTSTEGRRGAVGRDSVGGRTASGGAAGRGTTGGAGGTGAAGGGEIGAGPAAESKTHDGTAHGASVGAGAADAGAVGKVSARQAAVRRAASSGLSEKRAQTQVSLLQAGRALFTEQGIGATSVGDLCSRAGFTRGAFYSNFTDMDDFVRQLAEREWDRMTGFVREAVREALPDPAAAQVPDRDQAEQTLQRLADVLLLAMPVSREFYLLQNELVSYILRNTEHAQGLRRSYEAFKASLREVMVDGLAVVGRECLLGADDMTELLFAAAERSMRTALMEGGEDRLTELLDRTLPALLTQMTRPREG